MNEHERQHLREQGLRTTFEESGYELSFNYPDDQIELLEDVFNKINQHRKGQLDAQQLAVFETGARYQMYHALALLLVGVIATLPQISGRALQLAAFAFILGIVLFSGSLYLLALSGIRWLGAITPLGGISFLLGWLALIVAALRPAAD